jgi:predicted porin
VEEGVREKVRTYYVSGKYPLDKGFSINGSYEYEDGIEDYQTLKLGMRYDF